MIWHGLWWQWTVGGAEAVVAFLITRYYTNPVRKMKTVGITFGDGRWSNDHVTGKQFQRLQHEQRQYGGPKPYKHCAVCGQVFDLVDSHIFKTTLCATCLLDKQDWRSRSQAQVEVSTWDPPTTEGDQEWQKKLSRRWSSMSAEPPAL